MNRYIFLFLIAAFSLLLHAKCVAQKNIVYGAGITYTVGVPTFVPPGNSSRVAIDTVTSKWYEYATPGGWRWSGDRVQDISGCAAPAYVPGKAQSRLVLNACTEAQNGHGPELYKYAGSAWLCLNCGGNYTAGTGIDITGTEITNTAPDQVVSITGAGINAVTGTYPNFTVTGTEVDGSATNELQTLSVAGNNLTISDGNTVTLPTPSSTLDALADVTITAPTNAQILQYNTATTQWVNATLAAIAAGGNGQVQYNDSGALSASSNFYWDNANKRLGVGGTPSASLHIIGTTEGTAGRVWVRVQSTSETSGSGVQLVNNADRYAGFQYSGSSYVIGELFSIFTQSDYPLLFNTSGGGPSGGTAPIIFSAGGYANEAMRITGTKSVSIGTATPNVYAKLDVTSTTQGVLFPRMTTTQRDAIAAPPDGLVVYNTTAAKLQVRSASAWVDLH